MYTRIKSSGSTEHRSRFRAVKQKNIKFPGGLDTRTLRCCSWQLLTFLHNAIEKMKNVSFAILKTWEVAFGIENEGHIEVKFDLNHDTIEVDMQPPCKMFNHSPICVNSSQTKKRRRQNSIYQGSTFRVRKSRKTLWKLLWLFAQLLSLKVQFESIAFILLVIQCLGKTLNPLDIFCCELFDLEKSLFSFSWLKSFDNNRFKIYIQQIGNWMSWDLKQINTFGNISQFVWDFLISQVNESANLSTQEFFTLFWPRNPTDSAIFFSIFSLEYPQHIFIFFWFKFVCLIFKITQIEWMNLESWDFFSASAELNDKFYGLSCSTFSYSSHHIPQQWNEKIEKISLDG